MMDEHSTTPEYNPGSDIARIKAILNERSKNDGSLLAIAQAGLWFVGSTLLGVLFSPRSWGYGYKGFLMLLCVCVPPIIILGVKIRPMHKRWYNMLNQLYDIEDAGATIVLLDIVVDSQKVPSEAIRASLSTKLPKLQRVDGVRIRNEHRELLYEELKSGNVPLTLAILQTIERMTWVNALPHIEGLAKGEGIAKHNLVVHEAAQSCEHTLKLVAAQMEAPQTLLRASAPSRPPEQLLRPAYNSTSSPDDNAQLLRPTNGRDNPLAE